MNIRQPGHEPVHRKRQHALGRRNPLDLSVQTGKAVITQTGFGLQYLQARTQPDHIGSQDNVFSFLGNAFCGHDPPAQTACSAGCCESSMVECACCSTPPSTSCVRDDSSS